MTERAASSVSIPPSAPNNDSRAFSTPDAHAQITGGSSMKSVNRRLSWYRADRRELTPAQRRRVRKAMHRWSRIHGVEFLGEPQ